MHTNVTWKLRYKNRAMFSAFSVVFSNNTADDAFAEPAAINKISNEPNQLRSILIYILFSRSSVKISKFPIIQNIFFDLTMKIIVAVSIVIIVM